MCIEALCLSLVWIVYSCQSQDALYSRAENLRQHRLEQLYTEQTEGSQSTVLLCCHCVELKASMHGMVRNACSCMYSQSVLAWRVVDVPWRNSRTIYASADESSQIAWLIYQLLMLHQSDQVHTSNTVLMMPLYIVLCIDCFKVANHQYTAATPVTVHEFFAKAGRRAWQLMASPWTAFSKWWDSRAQLLIPDNAILVKWLTTGSIWTVHAFRFCYKGLTYVLQAPPCTILSKQ